LIKVSGSDAIDGGDQLGEIVVRRISGHDAPEARKTVEKME
jgi:hypothetical protein